MIFVTIFSKLFSLQAFEGNLKEESLYKNVAKDFVETFLLKGNVTIIKEKIQILFNMALLQQRAFLRQINTDKMYPLVTNTI